LSDLAQVEQVAHRAEAFGGLGVACNGALVLDYS
jgi:hypothetical protein